MHKKTPEESGALDLNTYYLYMKTKRLIKSQLILRNKYLTANFPLSRLLSPGPQQLVSVDS